MGRRYLQLGVVLAMMVTTNPPDAAAQDFTPAPAFDLPSLSGGDHVRLADYRGKVVYLDFWASWCAPCRLAAPAMKVLQADYAGRPFVVLSIDAERSRADGLAFLARAGGGERAAWDRKSETLRAYGGGGLPTGVLIDANGVIRLRHMGFQPEQNAFLKAHIDQLLAEQALGIVRAPNR